MQVNEVIHLPMKMEPTVSSETSAIRTQTPGNYPKRNTLLVHLEHGESLKTKKQIPPFQIMQTGPGTHSASNSMRTGSYSPAVKQSGCEAGYSSPYNADVKNVWSYTSIALCAFNFTVYTLHVGGNKI